VDENAAVLLEELNATNDPATVDLIASAILLHPICEFDEPLRAAAGRITAQNAAKRAEAARKAIAQECVPLNPKWAED
jgi:hypothetical protein